MTPDFGTDREERIVEAGFKLNVSHNYAYFYFLKLTRQNPDVMVSVL